ncbi:hypothetical protein AVEN_7910-1 [Araneus ventricosus]|uniref:Tc1-like transposase DDE domain-containing protein n=1 Tax=Araneus ventricosus TaxID=182803 RepID=A0A4Y2D1J7_ARAVE|nr:hypothetical protein AVEN_7910-1 [Araneus ventricosus]
MVSSASPVDRGRLGQFLFTDESRIRFSSGSRRQTMWHEVGSGYVPENMQERGRYGTCSIMVNDRMPRHELETGTITSAWYITSVPLPHVCLFQAAATDNFLFIEDNMPTLFSIVWTVKFIVLCHLENIRDVLRQ